MLSFDGVICPPLISPIALGVSCAVARSVKKNPGRLTMGQIELLAQTMGEERISVD